MTKKLSESMEDYLEAIHFLKKEKGVSRVSDISTHLDVRSSSVNAALQGLSKKGLVIHEKYGYVDLTEKGSQLATEVQNKHDILFRFLTEFLAVDKEPAMQEACRIEHAISQQTFAHLTRFFSYMDTQHPTWLPTLRAYLTKDSSKEAP